MANNVNNGITGVIDIPGALRSRGAADGNQVGGVVAYAGDIYDVTAGKNQSDLNAEFAEGIANAGISDVQVKSTSAGSYTTVVTNGVAKVDLSNINYNNLTNTPSLETVATSGDYDDLNNKPLTKNENEYGYSLGTGNHAEDFDSFAGGSGSKAKGEGSFSFGWESVAKGYYSQAFGGGANATSMYSHAEGLATNATGYESHAEGNGSMIETRTTQPYTSGDQYLYVETSVPVGSCIRYIQQGQNLYGIPAVTVTACVEDNGSYRLTLPSGGIDKSISNQGSVSISGAAYGVASHAEGQGTLAKGRASHAEGMNTQALNDCEHAEGKFNVSHSNTISSIGVGSASNDRKNAFEVTNNGDIYVKGLGSYDGTSISNVSTLQNVITGINTRVATLENSSSSSSSSYITYSEGEGYSLGDTATASGENSFAEGDSTTASGVTSHAEGYSTTAFGQGSHAEGGFSTASGDYSHAEGDSNTASGLGSHAEGGGTTASAECAHAEGNGTTASGEYSHAEGSYTQALGFASHAEGCGQHMNTLVLSTSSEYYYDQDDDVLYVFIDSSSSNNSYLNLPVGTVAAVATENTKDLEYVDYYSYISDKLYFVGPVDYECPVIAIKNIPQHVTPGSGINSLAPIVDDGRYQAGWGYKFTGTVYINFLSGSALGDESHSGGYQTNAIGQKSHTEGIRTVATNDGESAFGRYNVSENGTVFSVGCGEWNDQTVYSNSHNYSRDESLTGIKAGLNKYTTSKNALMVNEDGDVFIKGIGGYDGMDSTAQGVKSVQQVITELTQQIAALTNNQ